MHFDNDEIESICFDLGIDYDSLSGDSKLKKVVELIEYCARNGRIVQLVDECGRLRATAGIGWDGIRALAVSNPAAFLPQQATTDGEAEPGGKRPVVNLSPDRALKLGIALGALMVLLVACGFSGGLVAGRFIQFTGNPVPDIPSQGESLNNDFEAIRSAPSGAQAQLPISDIRATSFANLFLTGPDSPIERIHIRFLTPSQASANMTVTLPILGQRQVVAAYNIAVEEGRVVIQPETASVRLLDTGGLFGWVAIPTFMLGPITDFAQTRLDKVAQTVYVNRVAIRQGQINLWLTKK